MNIFILANDYVESANVRVLWPTMSGWREHGGFLPTFPLPNTTPTDESSRTWGQGAHDADEVHLRRWS